MEIERPYRYAPPIGKRATQEKLPVFTKHGNEKNIQAPSAKMQQRPGPADQNLIRSRITAQVFYFF